MRWAVVGAGSAGCVVTRRLVDAGEDVVLIEAGPPLDPESAPAAIDGPDALAALAEPGRTYSGLVAHRVAGVAPQTYWRGRGIGGSSAVNAMVARWGSVERYHSWGWDDVERWRSHVLVPVEVPRLDELGRVDRLLLNASPDAAVVPLTRRHGRRITSAEAYLWPIAGRFAQLTDAVVDRVALDQSGAATGVVLADGTIVAADRVVLCAGAIHTPPILLRSGVTDGVGVGLADHPAAGLVLQLGDPEPMGGLVTATTIEAEAIQWTPLNHLGPSANPALAMLSVAVLDPTSCSGTVGLRSDDPNDGPIVELDLFSADDDLDRLVDAMAALIDLVTDGPAAAGVDRVFIDDRGTDVTRLAARSALLEWVRTSGAGYVHASCSCSQAVAEHGHVLGHEGLTVADASVFPQIPDANLHLPVTLLAERFVAHWLASS